MSKIKKILLITITIQLNLFSGILFSNTNSKINIDQDKIQINRIKNIIQDLETQDLHISLNELYTHQKLFLHHLSPNNFMKLILKNRITDSAHQINPTLANQQTELLQLTIKHGAKLDEIFENLISSIQVDILFWNKELFLNELGASKFLILVVHSIIQLNPQNIALQLELAQLALDLGADPNFMTNGSAVTLSSSFEYTIELLQLLVDHGAKHTTNSERLEEIIEGGLAYILLDPQFILDQKYKNLNADEALEPKMPYIIHHIWLTHPSSPREIRDIDIANVIATKNIFSQSPVQWQQIVWTNDPQLFPESVNQLEQAGIQVKCIYDHQENLKLFYLIETLIDKKLWGQASDTLRIALLEYFGGVYADLNYIFNREITSETHKYNFFTSTYKDSYIANFFFGSSPAHPILQKTLSLIKRNLLTPPTYIGTSTYFATANPIYLAYYSQANQNGNMDVIYPSTSYYRRSKMNPNYHHHHPKTKKITPNSKKANQILKTICPMTNFDDYIQSREICGLETHFVGYDSPDGNTWLTNE